MTPAAYDAWYDSPRGRWIGEVEFALLRRHLGTDRAAGASLLDVGCGTGWFTRRLVAAGFAATGLDVDASMLAFARAHSPPEIDWLRADATRLPFADRAFDTVVSVTALCFVADVPRALAEMVRVARRRVVVGVLNRHSLLGRALRGRGSGGYQGAHWHSRAELVRQMATLPVRDLAVGSAVLLPAGDALARAVERLVPAVTPWGALLVASATPLAPAGTA